MLRPGAQARGTRAGPGRADAVQGHPPPSWVPRSGARPPHGPPQCPSPRCNHRHFLPVLCLPFFTPSAGNPRGEGMTGSRLSAPSGLACPAMPGLLGAAGPPGVCSVGVWRGHPDTQPARLEAPLTGREVLDPKDGHGRGGRGGHWPSQ